MKKKSISFTLLFTAALAIDCVSPQEFTDKDRVEIIRLTLERALIEAEIPDYHLISDKQNINLSTENITPELVPQIPGINLVLVNQQQIQGMSEEYLSFLSFKEISYRQGKAIVKIVNTTISRGGGFAGSLIIEYNKEKSKWVGRVVESSVS
jgi:hypothetical protein